MNESPVSLVERGLRWRVPAESAGQGNNPRQILGQGGREPLTLQLGRDFRVSLLCPVQLLQAAVHTADIYLPHLLCLLSTW